MLILTKNELINIEGALESLIAKMHKQIPSDPLHHTRLRENYKFTSHLP